MTGANITLPRSGWHARRLWRTTNRRADRTVRKLAAVGHSQTREPLYRTLVYCYDQQRATLLQPPPREETPGDLLQCSRLAHALADAEHSHTTRIARGRCGWFDLERTAGHALDRIATRTATHDLATAHMDLVDALTSSNEFADAPASLAIRIADGVHDHMNRLVHHR